MKVSAVAILVACLSVAVHAGGPSDTTQVTPNSSGPASGGPADTGHNSQSNGPQSMNGPNHQDAKSGPTDVHSSDNGIKIGAPVVDYGNGPVNVNQGDTNNVQGGAATNQNKNDNTGASQSSSGQVKGGPADTHGSSHAENNPANTGAPGGGMDFSPQIPVPIRRGVQADRRDMLSRPLVV